MTGAVQKSRLPLWLLLLIFIGLAISYNMATPLFESPDEISHFRYAAWFADGKGMPEMLAAAPTIGHEVWQPPLYYAFVGWLISAIPRPDEAQLTQLNPYWGQGGGKNLFYHLPAERFPYQQTSLAVHLARFVSTLLGCLTVIATYQLARLIAPDYALFAAALVVFNPQFLFISASVNNDNLVIALSALLLWLGIAWILPPRPALWRYFLLGGLWGLAILAKVNAASFGAIFLLLVGYTARRDRTVREVVLGLPLLGSAGIAVAGWWFIQNWATYGDPLAWSALRAITPDMFRPNWLSWSETLTYATGLFRSYWAMFGHGLSVGDGFYGWINGLFLLLLLGSFYWWQSAHAKERFIAFVCLLWQLILFLSLLRWMRQMAFTDQGRLLFAGIAAMGVWGAIGLAGWRQPMGNWLGKGLLVVLAGLAIASPWLVIAPAYAYPPTVPASTPIPNEMTVFFGDHLLLRGYELSPTTLATGATLRVHLYWQAVAPISENYLVAVHLLDGAGNLAATVDSIPYNGRYQTVVWQVNELFRDGYELPIISAEAVAGKATVLVKVYTWGKPDQLLPITVAGQSAGNTLTLAHLKIAPSKTTFAPSQTTEIEFAPIGRLIGFDAPSQISAGSNIPLTLYWQATQPNQQEYVVFVHLRDEQNQLVAQADSPPQNNRYPTSIWAAGEQIKDERLVQVPASLPPATYYLIIGWYDPITGQRLPATQSNGIPLPHNELPLTPIIIP